MGVLCAHKAVHLAHAVLWMQKMLDDRELELWMAVSHHQGAGMEQGLLHEHVLLITALSLHASPPPASCLVQCNSSVSRSLIPTTKGVGIRQERENS